MRIEFSRREEWVRASELACGISSGQRVQSVTYFFQSVRAGHWIGTDDMEFRAEESLSGDEVAQAVFLLCGGTVGHACGQVADYCVEYDDRRPATLRLHPLHGAQSQRIPLIYHRA